MTSYEAEPKFVLITSINPKVVGGEALYVAKADKRKVKYEKTMKAYNKKLKEGPKEGEEFDKSVSEVSEEANADNRSDE
ncbi:unnamed protein product, partial [Eruca vesicaria subsp. sativa]|nr:unnamed protein product [Eruca vesicaria subsp. sativa]